MNAELDYALRRLIKSVVNEVANEVLEKERKRMLPKSPPFSSPVQRAVEPETRLLVGTRDAAKRLSVSERTLWGLTKAGSLPCVRIGFRVLYSLETLQRWIQDSERRESAKLRESQPQECSEKHQNALATDQLCGIEAED